MSFLKRLTTPDNVAPNSYQKIEFGYQRPIQTREESRRDSSAEGLNTSAFSRLVDRNGKPAFNVISIRKEPAAGKEGFITFNPGPGSYTTRMSSMKTHYITREMKIAAPSLKQEEPGYFFTKNNGGLKKQG